MSQNAGRREVVVTATAKSKAHRMFSERALVSIARAAAAGRGGHIFRKGLRSDEYHVLSDGYAVVVMDDGELVVVTQMHQHADYWNDSVYEKVDRIPGGRDD